MSDSNTICKFILNKKQFKVRLPHYDGGSQIFWPEYRWSTSRVMGGDMIAFDYGHLQPQFALVRNMQGDLLSLTIVAKESEPNPTVHVKINKSRVLAIMHPE